MAKLYIKDFAVNTNVDTFVVIKQKDLRKTQKGDPYLALKLTDKTGDIEARFWDGFQEIQALLKEKTVIRVYGDISEYPAGSGVKQITIKKAKIAEPNEIDPSDFIRTTKKNIEEMYANILGIIESISDVDIKKILQIIFQDKTISELFKKTPAAMSMHSACIGGLLEHVDGMVPLAIFIADQYTQINRDLLIAGVLLHDIGKTQELDFKNSISYTDEGKLVGHIVQGVKILNEKVQTIAGFPVEKRMLLEHMILSHHGVPEFGAVKVPMTLEAVVLHHIDNIDAKIVGFTEFVEQNPTDGSWTPKAFMFENQSLYIGGRK
jgi:3'-5' exoribonuclease